MVRVTNYVNGTGAKNLLINDDCLFGMNLLAAKSVDMVLCDLPFATTKHVWDKMIDLSELWKHWKRVCKPTAAIVLFAVQPFTTQLINSNPKGYKYSWVWNKHESGNFAVAKKMPLTITEEILVFSLLGRKVEYFPQMAKGEMRTKGGKNSKKNGSGFGGLANISYTSDMYYPKNLLDFPSVPRKQRLHPSQKPTALLQYLIRTYTQTGDTVLDCAMGSGSTGLAARNEQRNFVGIEKDRQFFEIAESRL